LGDFPWAGEIQPPRSCTINGMSTTPDTHATSDQAAAQLHITKQTAAAYVRRNWLKGRKVGRSWLIEIASIDRLMRCGPPAR